MKLGIVGLPNVGKTTLFNALTGSQAETGSYTVAGAKPNIGTAKVPDERLDWLADYYHPKKYTPATIEFVDVPGVAAGGKGREVFQAIRMVDALVEVVRCFDDDSIFLEEADAPLDEALDEQALIDILVKPRNALVKQYQRLLGGQALHSLFDVHTLLLPLLFFELPLHLQKHKKLYRYKYRIHGC